MTAAIHRSENTFDAGPERSALSVSGDYPVLITILQLFMATVMGRPGAGTVMLQDFESTIAAYIERLSYPSDTPELTALRRKQAYDFAEFFFSGVELFLTGNDARVKKYNFRKTQ
jgi:hypothetical protein